MLAGGIRTALKRAFFCVTFLAFKIKLLTFTATKLTNRPSISCHTLSYSSKPKYVAVWVDGTRYVV
jgi:hypothetical protein